MMLQWCIDSLKKKFKESLLNECRGNTALRFLLLTNSSFACSAAVVASSMLTEECRRVSAPPPSVHERGGAGARGAVQSSGSAAQTRKDHNANLTISI